MGGREVSSERLERVSEMEENYSSASVRPVQGPVRELAAMRRACRCLATFILDSSEASPTTGHGIAVFFAVDSMTLLEKIFGAAH